ncbi:MAG: DUF4173 domain-containing protein [Lachnospiraceae bacterium]|nr:DUF4173 domain-containing protein [Lachnospiraceae bacterium]
MIASSTYRMRLYNQAYHLTFLRFLPYGFYFFFPFLWQEVSFPSTRNTGTVSVTACLC